LSPTNAQNQHVVTAVIVAHDGAAWIPRVTEALVNQTRPVQRVVGVDTGSRDRSGAMLAEALGRAAVFGMDRGTGYAAAVHQALRHRAAATHLPPSAGAPAERTEWVWLLHDDCEPEPDALEQLLLGADQVPTVAVLGPKVMDWSDRGVLLEAGVGIDRAGRRITGIEPREADQGQHDGNRDVLAVGSAGMLVRRDVWSQVGGFDPGMRLYREDVDFCWRVQAAGYRVRVITDAVVYHVEASARRRRQASAAPRRGREDRRNALLVLLGNLPPGPMLFALAGNLVLSTLRTLFFLFAKRAGAALDELAGFFGAAGHPLRLLAARRRRSRGRRGAYGRLRSEVPPGHSVRKLAEFATGALSKSLPVDMVGSHHATEDPTDDDSLLVDTGIVQRVISNPGVLLFLVLTTIALVAERSLLSSSPLGGGALVPAWGGSSDLWAEYVQGFHPAGIGTAAGTPPYVAVIALLATLLGGKPWLAVDVILIGCIPLAGITAYLASRRITRSVPVRIWAAMAYALLPVGMGAVAAGRLGTALVLVLLPLIGVVAARVFTHGPRRARRAAWAAALLVAVAAAFVPLVWALTVVAMALGAFVFRRGRTGVIIDVAIVAVVPVVLLLPWSIALATHPSQLLLEAGLQPAGLATPHLPARSLMLLSPGGPGLPPFWVTAGLLLAAAVALVASGRRALVLAGWAAALLGLLAAAGVSKLIVTPAAGGDPVLAWPGLALAFAGAGLLLAAAACGDLFRNKLGSGGWRAPSGIAVLALAAVACTAPVLAAAAWVTTGVRGPVAPSAGPVLPEFVAVSSDTGLRLRTLVLRVGPRGRVAYSVLRDTDPLIGASELAVPPAAQRALNLTVATLTAPYGGSVQDQGRSLAQLGIGYVLLPTPINPDLARLLDGVPDLRPVSQTAEFALWRVSDTTARVRVVGQNGTVVPVNSGTVRVAGASVPAVGGTLVLAEPAGGWSATLNGHPLTPLVAPVGGWAQGFRLPAGGGSLTVSHSQLSRIAVVALEALAVVIVIVLGLPGARMAGEAEAGAAATAAARRSGRTRDQAGDGGHERKPSRRAKGKPGSPARPRVPRPPVPAAQGAQRGPGAAPAEETEVPAGVRGAAPAGVRGAAAAGVRGAAGGGGMPWPDEPAATGSFPGDVAADSPTMVSQARGGTDVRGRSEGRPPAGGRNMPGDPRGLPPRGGPGPGRRGVRAGPEPGSSRGRPGYDPAGGRGGRPGYDTGPDRPVPPGSDPGARRGRPGYDTGPDRAVPPGSDPGSSRGRPGYDTGPGRAVPPGPGPGASRGRPGYDTGPGRAVPPGSDPGGSRGRPGYDTGPGRAVPPGPGPGASRGRPGYDTGPGRAVPPGSDPGGSRGRPGYDTGSGRARPEYDPDPGHGGQRSYEPEPDRARPGYDPTPGRDRRPGYDTAPGRAGRPGYGPVPGDDGRSGADRAPRRGRRGREPEPDRGRAANGPVPGGDGGPGYDAPPGRGGQPEYDTAPGGGGRRGYDTPPASGGRPGYDTAPGRGRRGREPGPDRGRAGYGPAPGRNGGQAYSPPPDAQAERGERKSRIGWPGRGSRSGRDRGPAGGERPVAGAQRGGPSDDEALSPLPPLPPRRPTGMDGYATDAGGPDWDAGPQRDPGETDW
jgi:GT2 family glycosyltransferase